METKETYFINPPTADGAMPDVYQVDKSGNEEHMVVFSGTQQDCEAFIAKAESQKP